MPCQGYRDLFSKKCLRNDPLLSFTSGALGCHCVTGHVHITVIISWNYSQGQKHVIQLKKSQELISPNMSSQLQLGNSPELLFFISTGRCQLDDFRGSSPGFCCGVPLNFLALRSQLKNSFKLIFEICHLTFNLKCFGINFDLISTFTVISALHYIIFAAKNSAAIILLYITLSWPQLLGCTSSCYSTWHSKFCKGLYSWCLTLRLH